MHCVLSDGYSMRSVLKREDVLTSAPTPVAIPGPAAGPVWHLPVPTSQSTALPPPALPASSLLWLHLHPGSQLSVLLPYRPATLCSAAAVTHTKGGGPAAGVRGEPDGRRAAPRV